MARRSDGAPSRLNAAARSIGNDGDRNNKAKIVRADVLRIAGKIALMSPERDAAKAGG
jgi:hypothetical protein